MITTDSVTDVIVRVYRCQDDGTITKCLMQKTMMSYFFDQPGVLLDLIKNKLGPGCYQVDKYTTDARFIETKTHSVVSRCECSIQRIMVRGCQNPYHV